MEKKIDYIVAFEMGGLNTPIMLSLGARTDIPVIDGDGLGRAAPETQMTSFIGHDISLTPMPLVDVFGNKVVVRNCVENTFCGSAWSLDGYSWREVWGRTVITQ